MSSRLLAVIVAIVAAACGSAPRRARRPGEELLAAIRIDGNTAIEDDALIRGLSLTRAQKGGRGIDEYQLQLDLARITGAYQRRGFLGVKVVPRVERQGDAATLIFEVTEGARAPATVEIVGLPPEVPLDEARALVALAEGDPFSYAIYDEAKAPLLALVENAGYAHVQLDAAALADPPNNRVTLRYTFDTGPRVRFGEVEVVGASGRLAEAIRERAAFVAGDVYSTTAVARAQQAIYGIGRFTSVRVDVDRANLAEVVPVKITVAEAKPWELRVGGGGGVDSLTYQTRLRFSLSHAGWPTPLTKLGVEFRPAWIVLREDCTWYEPLDCDSNLRMRLIGSATQQDLFFRGLHGEAEGGLDYLTLEAYTYYGARAQLGLALPLNLRRIQARVGWQLSAYDFSDLDPAVTEDKAREIGIDQFQRNGAFTQAIVVDYRDDPVSPRLGGYAELRLAEGTAIAGGAFDYVQIQPDVRAFVPFGRVVLAARARLGMFRGDVPPTERYYAGGASSQRGFAERRLSPLARNDIDTNDDGIPDTEVTAIIGGVAAFETSAELRTSFKPWGIKVGAVAFVDAADVTESADALRLGNLHWAVGVGIRPYYLPVGPIRIDVGYRLNRTGAAEPSPGQRWNYFFSVGEAF